MEAEYETRPLLHDFESETWRSRARKRCLRIPSEAAITGLILGVFFVVVTLLIVLENMNTTKKDDISIDKNLLASPNFNQKLSGKTWQEHKQQKLDKANKDWKLFPNISASSNFNQKLMGKTWQEHKQQKLDKANKDWNQFPDVSASSSFNAKQKDKSWQDEKQRKFDKVNKGWKILPDVAGKRDNSLDDVRLKDDWIENKDTSRSPLVIDQYGREEDDRWASFFSSEKRDPNVLKSLNKDMTDVANLLQSPNVKKEKIDDGWKKLSAQGAEDRDIRGALIKALIERKKELNGTQDAAVPQSQYHMSLDELWERINESWQDKVARAKEERENRKMKNKKVSEDQMGINDEWKNKFNILQSPKADAKNTAQDDDGWKKLAEQGWTNKRIEEELNKAWNEKKNLSQSPMNVQSLWGKTADFLRNIVEKDSNNKGADKEEYGNKKLLLSPANFGHSKNNVMETTKKLKKDYNKEGETEEPEKESPSAKFEYFINLIIEKIKEHQKENKEEEDKQTNINDEWKNKMNVLQTSEISDQKWKTINDHWKTLIEHERNSHFAKNGEQKETTDKAIDFQYSRSTDDMKWKKVDKGWKMISEYGWKDNDMKESVEKATTSKHQLLQSGMGYNDMKWKKVNDGYKKFYNKNLGGSSRCPMSNAYRMLSLNKATLAPPIDCALIAEKVRRKYGKCIDLSLLPALCNQHREEACLSTYKYRQIDGACNNLIQPTWGKSGMPFQRMLESEYADGVSTLRKAKDGGELPNARYISRELYSKRRKPDGNLTVLFLYFGLIVDHDMIQTSLNSNALPCCDKEVQESEPNECLQIDISDDDPFYGPKNVKCLNLVRSFPVNGPCAGKREQFNEATSFIDASTVYGSSIEHSNHLRTFNNGQLRTQLINSKPFMSNSEEKGSTCGTKSEPLKCFEAGDSRVNMLVELTVMHTIWYREHNRIATELHKINPKWSDEVLFQETRRIVIGELQHITYSQFLPLLLGDAALKEYDLMINESKIYDLYDNSVNPSIYNAFGAAAFRFAHSLVPDMQYLMGQNSTLDQVALRHTFFSATLLYHDGFDLLLRGAVNQRTYSVDSYFSPEIREHLFQPADFDYGFDLAAIGIQRGRDHGLPPYVRWRTECGLPEVKNWKDLRDVMNEKSIQMFRNIYRSVEDIDLITGALAERRKLGSLLGPTYTCVIGRQFRKTRKGDRFWFEMQNKIGSFTKSQLEEIYKSSMARIICDNSDNIKEIQRNSFLVPSKDNPILDCDKIERVDLSKWISSI